MKLYKPVPDEVFRVSIVQLGSKTERVNLADTSVEEAINYIKEIVILEATPIKEGKRTTVTVRRSVGKENYESQTFSCYGIKPNKIYKMIMDFLNNYANA